MKLNIFPLAVLVLTSSILLSCSKEEKEIKDNDPISSKFGEFITIDGFDESIHVSSDLTPTDEGLYITIGSLNEEDYQIFRYNLNQSDILDGSWEKVPYNITPRNDYFSEVTPLNSSSEAVSEHEVLVTPMFQAFETPIYRTFNMASGNIKKEENAPVHEFTYAGGGTYENVGHIIMDDWGQSWAVFSGGTVSDENLHVIKMRYGNLPFDLVCTITAKGTLYYTASMISARLYALSHEEQKLYIIDPGGEVIAKDLSPFYDQNLSPYHKNKFRFSPTGVFFQFQDKVLKLIDDDNLTLFYTIKYNIGGSELGDFCVDHQYLFATDGTRKELTGFNSEVNIIPPQPNTSNPQVLIDYIEHIGHFQNGELETSSDRRDNYIYVLGGNGKILVVSKHYL